MKDLKSIIYIHHEKYTDAEKLLLDLLETRKKINQEESSEYALSLMNIGVLYIKLQRAKEAIKYLEIAFEKCKQIYGLNHPYTASALTSLGDANTLIINYTKANEIYDQASKILSKYFGKDHFEYFINQLHYAKLLRLQGKTEEAKKIFLSIDEIPKNHIKKLSKYLSERELENLVKIFKEYNQELYCLTQLRKEDPELCTIAYENAIYYKAYILESLSKLRNAIVAAKSIQTIQDQLISLTRQLEAELKLPESERKNITILENEINSLETQMKSEINSISKEDQRISFEDIRQSLRTNDAAVECITFIREDSTYYAAFLITSDSEYPEFIDLSSEDEIKKLIQPSANRQSDYVSYIYDFQKRGVLPTTGEKKHLYDLLWSPLVNRISSKQKIYFSNSGYLHRIALQAIPIAIDQVIADRFTIIYVNSTRDVLHQFEQSDLAYNNKVMLVGGLEYDGSVNDLVQTNKPRGETNEIKWQYLPWTEKEIMEIQKICQNSSLTNTIITKKDATENRITNVLSKEFPRIIHFSTHGIFDSRSEPKGDLESRYAQSYDMSNSALVLSGANELKWNVNPEADGYLSALEISKMDLSKTELAVLSACETGLGTIDHQEGVYGLQRAFQIAGVKNIIFSLWQVPDRETKDFMANFYLNWLQKKLSIRDAFSLTQKEMRERFINPFQWAGFVLVE
jgi:CHAT domain-containing protein